MDLNEYQDLAQRTSNPDLTNWQKVQNGCYGMCGEAGECIDLIKKVREELNLPIAIMLDTKGPEYRIKTFENGKIVRKTNNAGGLEGGITNGENLVVKASMKAIPTMKTSLSSINLKSKEAISAHFERSDTCAVSACGVVADAMVATVLVNAFLEKFGQDNLEQIKRNYSAYEEMLRERFE